MGGQLLSRVKSNVKIGFGFVFLLIGLWACPQSGLAQTTYSSTTCTSILALGTTGTDITFSGDQNLHTGTATAECGIYADSSSANAVVVAGHGSVSTAQIGTAGGILTGTETVSGPLSTAGGVVTDPLASLPAPTLPTTIEPAPTCSSGTLTLSSSVVYEGTIDITGTCSVSYSGVGLYIENGNFNDTSSGRVIIESTIFLVGSQPGNLLISPSGVVSLTSYDVGTFSGILVYQQPGGSDESDLISESEVSNLQLYGLIYAPSANVDVSAEIDGGGMEGVSFIVNTIDLGVPSSTTPVNQYIGGIGPTICVGISGSTVTVNNTSLNTALGIGAAGCSDDVTSSSSYSDMPTSTAGGSSSTGSSSASSTGGSSSGSSGSSSSSSGGSGGGTVVSGSGDSGYSSDSGSSDSSTGEASSSSDSGSSDSGSTSSASSSSNSDSSGTSTSGSSSSGTGATSSTDTGSGQPAGGSTGGSVVISGTSGGSSTSSTTSVEQPTSKAVDITISNASLDMCKALGGFNLGTRMESTSINGVSYTTLPTPHQVEQACSSSHANTITFEVY